MAPQRGESPGHWKPCASRSSARRDPKTLLREDKGATRSSFMMDLLMLALGFGFFALAIGYTYACERL